MKKYYLLLFVSFIVNISILVKFQKTSIKKESYYSCARKYKKKYNVNTCVLKLTHNKF